MGYRGEVFFKFKPTSFFNTVRSDREQRNYEIGERIGQLLIIPYPKIEIEEVEELTESERGTGGYGSTGV